MATLCKTFPSDALATQAAEALRSAGVPGRDIRVLTGRPEHDVRREPMGRFTGSIAPDERVGTYGNAPRLRSQAKGGWAGHPDEQRQGTFADSDLDVIVTGDGRSQCAGDHAVARLLHESGVSDAEASRLLADVHRGCAVVLADVAEVGPGEALARLEHVTPAA
jgi:hypothetical protein